MNSVFEIKGKNVHERANIYNRDGLWQKIEHISLHVTYGGV